MVEASLEALNGCALRAAHTYFRLSENLSGGRLDAEFIEPTRRARQAASEVLTVIGLIQVNRLDTEDFRNRMTRYVLDLSRSREV